MHPGHAAAMMAAGLNGTVAAPLPLEADERPAKRPRTGNRMVRRVTLACCQSHNRSFPLHPSLCARATASAFCTAIKWSEVSVSGGLVQLVVLSTSGHYNQLSA